MEKLSYALGMVIAHNLKGMGVSALDNAAFTQAVSDVMGGATTTMSDAEAQRTVSEFMQKQQAEADEAVRTLLKLIGDVQKIEWNKLLEQWAKGGER